MKMKKWLATVLALAMLTALSACSTADGGKNAAGSDDTATESGVWNPTVPQRAVLAEDGSPCGVVNLLYDGIYDAYNHDIVSERQYFTDIIAKSGYTEEFDFLASVPDEYWAGTAGGSDFYLIIPADENAKVEVNTLELSDDVESVSFNTVETIYSQDNGAPFLLKCNVGDIFPECRIVITDSKGDVFEWSPMISMRDGSVFTTGEDGRKAHDFTHYPDGIPEED